MIGILCVATLATLRAIIVDDEPLSRLALSQLLARVPDVAIVGEYRTVADANSALNATDVVFLDIQMPGETGLSAATRWCASGLEAPFVVFVTAFERYALPAFETEAVDYLTKPVRASRLDVALQRVRSRMSRPTPRDDDSATNDVAKGRSPLVARVGASDVVIPLDRVGCIEADGVYAAVWIDARRVLVRASLDALEQRLRPAFVRVHRSWLVPLSRVAALHSRRGAKPTLVLDSGRVVPVSRRRLAGVRRSLREGPRRAQPDDRLSLNDV